MAAVVSHAAQNGEVVHVPVAQGTEFEFDLWPSIACRSLNFRAPAAT